MNSNKKIKRLVQQNYGRIALTRQSCCLGNSCCNTIDTAQIVGYTPDEVESLHEANLGLGCGNPNAFAFIKDGDVVLDLGSGPGLDCFLAAKKVWPNGKVIGVDMTPEMISVARKNAEKLNIHNVEFIIADIESLPLEDNSIDVIISNCVINLAPDKEKVFKEAFRVLKNGGRISVSDIVLDGELPPKIKDSSLAYVGCVAGAIQKDSYISLIRNAGFNGINIVNEVTFGALLENSDVLNEGINLKSYNDVVKSISVVAWK